MMKLWFWVAGVMVMTCLSFTTQQAREISGTVKSSVDGYALAGASVILRGTTVGTFTDSHGKYKITSATGNGTLVFSFIGYKSKEVKLSKSNVVNVTLEPDTKELEEVVVTGYGTVTKKSFMGAVAGVQVSRAEYDSYSLPAPVTDYPQQWNTEEYKGIQENIFHDVLRNPLSTFSIDVDAASYSNVRRFIQNGQRPPVDAVRIEEMVNYFSYDYPQPRGEHPFDVFTEISVAPWNPKHKLVHIGLQGRKVATENLPPSNLVFLIDVSGSMSDPNKLPLLKSSFRMLVESLRPQDHVAIVVYAGAAGLVLEPTSGADKQRIVAALDNLQAGGSTAGGEGINLAYAVAKQHFKREGNNRVILATDGDFNIGESSDAAMERLIESKRNDGIFLTVLGYGMGNYKDSKMEVLADKGNGNYAYIDNLTEARKVLVNEFGGTLFTIAKDVKLQLEFNPAHVKSYRLIGYENRMLQSEDFNNDRKDAGELGSGHTVTALYEIIPTDSEEGAGSIDPLKYQPNPQVNKKASQSEELLTIKLRYKKPDGDVSRLLERPVRDGHTPLDRTSDNFRWSASVAGFGMLLRDSEYVKGWTYDHVLSLAQGARGTDKEGYRMEFINMVKSYGMVASR